MITGPEHRWPTPPHRPATARTPRPSEARDLANRECGALAHRPADAAAGALAAHRSRAAAGRPELGLAQVRHARRLLALPRRLPEAWHLANSVLQRLGLPGIPARSGRGPGCRLGLHGPWLLPGTEPPRRRSTRHDLPERRDHRGFTGAPVRGWLRPSSPRRWRRRTCSRGRHPRHRRLAVR